MTLESEYIKKFNFDLGRFEKNFNMTNYNFDC